MGTSLATILEIPDTTDFLKTLIHLLQEYEAFGNAESRSKSVMFSLLVLFGHLKLTFKCGFRFFLVLNEKKGINA
jgi:hypothetical protein